MHSRARIRCAATLTAVLVAAPLVGVASAPAGAAAPPPTATAPISALAVDPRILSSFDAIEQAMAGYRTAGRLAGHVADSLADRLTRARALAEQGAETRTIAYVEQFAARARNQVKGDADDLAVRADLVSRAEQLIVLLREAEEAENAGGTTIGTVPAAGGTVALAGIASVAFPADAFEQDTSVRITAASDAAVVAAYAETGFLFDAGPSAPLQVVLRTGAAQPRGGAQVTLDVPAQLRSALPAEAEIRVFARNVYADEDERHETYEPLDERFARDSTSVTVAVPAHFFGPDTSGAGRSLTLVLGSTPTADPQAPAAARGAAARSAGGVATAAADCQGSSLEPPLATMNVSSPFGPRSNPFNGTQDYHYGVDFDVPTGTNVMAVADGVAERVTTQTANGQVTGWGNYVVVRHADGSKSLYAHLLPDGRVAQGATVTAGQVIAQSDNSGSSTGPHLHLEYAPNGQIYDKAAKVDPQPCIGQNVEGSITVRDNGTLADDAFTVRVEGLVVCRTTIGASNTCAVGSLRPGQRTLSLTADIAPDDVGTYEITLGRGLTFSTGGTSASGVVGQGDTATYTIVVPSG
ncbi:M23 family metallopeptidase [Motilibacter deserti]|uniref:M23 family metallopeptidase n=1 Tax=Motilibacter deserti TaxID=2714956 RepID=A0ABX0GT54_9ACTN|nr:M23 family metallopeptidase [Motilibacter deserti]NHC12999.1 M23 family metallopeptidase [Motilibacter deserti]